MLLVCLLKFTDGGRGFLVARVRTACGPAWLPKASAVGNKPDTVAALYGPFVSRVHRLASSMHRSRMLITGKNSRCKSAALAGRAPFNLTKALTQ